VDAFALGANLPWLQYGGDFGANAWQPRGGLAARGVPSGVDATLASLADAGASTVRWFLFCDGRAGIVFDEAGWPAGLDEAVFADIDAAVALARRTGVRVVFTLFDFLWCRRGRHVDGVRPGGHRHVLTHAPARAALLDRVVAPVLRRYGAEPAIAAWDVVNEPDWVTRGLGARNPFAAVRRDAMRALIGDTASLVHALATQPVTVGSARTSGLPLVRGAGLDFYQVHWYDRFERQCPIATPARALGLDRPVVLGELPTRGSRHDANDLIAIARRGGYAGAWLWSLYAEDGATDGRRAADALRVSAASRDPASDAP
jgi:mannan endo-1,4-beta-mannosidase